MLIEEYPWTDRTDRIRHHSDAGMLIEQNQTGRRYEDAIDVYPTAYTYTETNEPIPEPPEEENTKRKGVRQNEKLYNS